MKIFLIEWPENLTDIARDLKAHSCDILYWTGVGLPGSEYENSEFPNTIFQNSYDAVKAIPAKGIEANRFEPLGRDTIEKFLKCESETLSMMNRIDYSNASFRERKHLYYDLLKYWRGVLRSLRPDGIVFSTTPHLVYDFVLYSVARELGIQAIMFIPTRVPDRLLIINDVEKGSDKLIKEIGKAVDAKFEDLSADMQDYYISQTSKEEISRFPLYTHAELYRERIKVLYAPSFQKIWASLKDLSFLRKSKDYLRRIFFTRSRLLTFGSNYTGILYQKKLWEWQKMKEDFKKEYKSLQSEVDWDRKFIYAPLQFQPERSTSPEGGVFVDQFLMIDILSRSIPSDWLIYIKEHLSQWTKGGTHAHQGRHKGYYKKLASFENVRLVSPQILSNKLIEKAQAVATVAGTGSWEAVLNGKPSLLFGYPSYKDCSEILQVSSVSSCREAINKIISGYKPDKQRVLNYLAAFDRVSIRARIEQGVEKTLVASSSQNNKAIADAICAELE